MTPPGPWKAKKGKYVHEEGCGAGVDEPCTCSPPFPQPKATRPEDQIVCCDCGREAGPNCGYAGHGVVTLADLIDSYSNPGPVRVERPREDEGLREALEKIAALVPTRVFIPTAFGGFLREPATLADAVSVAQAALAAASPVASREDEGEGDG